MVVSTVLAGVFRTHGTWVKLKERVMRKPAKRILFSTLNNRLIHDEDLLLLLLLLLVIFVMLPLSSEPVGFGTNGVLSLGAIICNSHIYINICH